jgi:hypothetical protein
MTTTAKDTTANDQASREEARRRLEKAHRIAERIPMTVVYTGLGPYKIEKSQK